MTTSDEMYRVECRQCGKAWGPYDGTKWRTPLEQAQCAVGGVERMHQHDDLRVVEHGER